MNKPRNTQSKDTARRWLLLGIPILFVVGALMHFTYEWSGNSTLVGIFAPVNESVWEHLKMAFWPIVIWWLIGYFVLGKNHDISAARWFTSAAVSAFIAMLFIVTFFYTYTGSLGIESVIVDIISLLLGFIVGQYMALHVYKYAKLGPASLIIAVAVLLCLSAAFIVFTFNPPHLPIFLDPTSGKYGI